MCERAVLGDKTRLESRAEALIQSDRSHNEWMVSGGGTVCVSAGSLQDVLDFRCNRLGRGMLETR